MKVSPVSEVFVSFSIESTCSSTFCASFCFLHISSFIIISSPIKAIVDGVSLKYKQASFFSLNSPRPNNPFSIPSSKLCSNTLLFIILGSPGVLKEDWYNWRRLYENYPQQDWILIDKTILEKFHSILGEVPSRINAGMKIYSDFLNKAIPEIEAIKSLKTIIEYDDKDYNRIGAVQALGKFGIKKEIFKFIENIVVSDENPYVRREALRIIFNLYFNESIEMINWVLQYDPSEEVFCFIVK